LCVCMKFLLFPRASTINERRLLTLFLNMQNSFLSYHLVYLSWACARFNTMFFFRMYIEGNPSLRLVMSRSMPLMLWSCFWVYL
jgi:hypothetical protein